MRRRIIFLLVALIAAACSGDDTATEDELTYFADASSITSSYETAVVGYFEDYLTALNSATAETGDAIFVDANKALFAGLASEFDVAVNALDALSPPADVEAAHEEWVAAGEALNEVFQGAHSDLAALDEAAAVNDVVSELPVQELQAAYREACREVAELATGSDDPAAVIVCEPPADG